MMATKKTEPTNDETSETPEPATPSVDEVPATDPTKVVVHSFDNGYGAKVYVVAGQTRLAPIGLNGRVQRRLPGIDGVFPREVDEHSTTELLKQIADI